MGFFNDSIRSSDTNAAPDQAVGFAALDATASLEGNSVNTTGALIAEQGQEQVEASLMASRTTQNRSRWLRFGILAILILIGLGVILVRHGQTQKLLNNAKIDASQRYSNTSVTLGNTSGGAAVTPQNTLTLSVNGQLNVSDGIVLTPGGQPANPVTGQLYYDKAAGRLSYYDGKTFMNILAGQGGNIVEGIGSASGKITLGQGLVVTNNVLSNNGVLTLQGEAGNVVFASGNGISINGTTVNNSGVVSVAGQTGDLTLGPGLKAVGTQLQNSGVISASAGTDIAITNDGNGNIIISATGGSATGVSSPGGTTGKIAVFTGSQTIADSLLSQTGSTVTVNGNLAITGSITLAAPLGVSQGGTGQATLPAGGILLGNGTGAISSATGTNGQCLVIAGGTPTFTSCPGAAGVNGSGTGGTIALWNGSGTVTSLASSILSQDSGATTVSVTGALSVSGAITAASLSGNGSGVTNVDAITLGGNNSSYYTNASNIATGTLNDGRLSTNVALRNADNNFTGTNLQHNGNAVCDTSGNCVGTGTGGGIGGGGTANQIAMFNGSGFTISNSILSQDAGATAVSISGDVNGSGSVTAATFSGNGAAITNVDAAKLGGQAGSYYTNASNISSGALNDSRLSANVTLQGNSFNGVNQLLQLNGSGFLPALNASLLTNINATNIATGSLNDARLSANVALYNKATSNFTGNLQHNGNDVCDTSGNCAGSGIGGGGTANQIALFTGSGFTVGDSILSQDAGATIISVDGDLSVSGNISAATLTGNGSGVTNVNAAQLAGNSSSYYTNASNIATGTLNDGRLSGNVTLLNGNNNFTGTTLQHSGNDICDASNNCGYLTGGTASGAYIQLQPTTPGTAQTGNINISDTAIAGSVKATTIYQNGNAVCDTSGNCAGTSGGGIGGSGTANQIAMFNGSGFTIGDSILSQDAGATTVGISGALNVIGTISAASLSGNGSAVTNVDAAQLSGQAASYYTNASNINSGTLADTHLTANVTLQGNAFNGPNELLKLNGSGFLPALNGSLLTAVDAATLQGQAGSYYTNASNLSSGTLSDSRLSSNAALYNKATSNFTGNLQHNGNDVCDTSGNCAGSGGGVTTSGGTANTLALFSGSGTIANSIISQNAGATTVTISGNVTVTGSVVATSLSGNGSGVTNVNASQLSGQAGSYYTNASNIAAGTLGDSYLSNNAALYNRTTSNFTGALQQSGNAVCTTAGNCVGSGAGGALGGSGSANTIAMFNGSGYTVANSLLSQNAGATTVTVAGNEAVGGTLSSAGLLTASNGLTVSTGTITLSNLTGGASTCLTLDGSNHVGVATCASGSGSTPSLQDVYNNSGSTPNIALASKGITIQDSASPVSGNLLAVNNSAGTTTYFAVTASGASINGTVTATAFSGDGSAITNVNAATLQGQAGSYYTNASNLSSGTLADGRLSSNAALYNRTTSNFTGSLQHNGNTVCDASGNCVGVAGGGVGGGGTLNTIALFTGSGYTVGNSLLTQNAGATTVTVTGVLTATGTVTATAFSGDGSAITNVNAAKLGGQAGSYYTNASNINAGTIGDSYLSSNAALYNRTTSNFTGALQQNGSNVCTTLGNCTGVSGGAVGGSGSANTIAMFNGSGYTIGNSILAQDAGATTLTVGGALTSAGTINAVAGFDYNGTAGATTTCSGGQFLQNQVVQGGITTGGTCATAGGGVTTVGTLDGGTANATGATISGSTIYLQSASASFAGLVNTSTQTFAGAKAFTGAATFSSTINTNTFTSDTLTFGSASTATIQSANNHDLIVKAQGSGALTLSSSLDISLNGNEADINTGSTNIYGSFLDVGSISTFHTNVTLSGTGSNQLAVTGAPTNSSTTSLIRIGSAIVGGNTSTNGGTYLGLNAPSNGVGSAADLVNFQHNGSSVFKIDASGSTTIQGNASVSGTTLLSGATTIHTTSTAAFSIQDASSVSLLNVDTSTGTITLGSAASGNYITVGATGITAFGSAQHTKTLDLTAEYAGAVLDAQSDSSCSSASNGTMTSGYDSVHAMSYYDWVSNASAQCYDVVARIKLPTDFNGWTASAPLTLKTYTTNKLTGLLEVDLRDTTNTGVAGCAYASATPGTNSSWTTAGSTCTFTGGTYTAGGVITLRIRMTASSADEVRIGDLSLNYYSKF